MHNIFSPSDLTTRSDEIQNGEGPEKTYVNIRMKGQFYEFFSLTIQSAQEFADYLFDIS